MMKTFFLSILLGMSLLSFAQSERYQKAMEQHVPSVDTALSPDALLNLANTFQRIAEAEKDQWLPYYYAALCQVTRAYMIGGETPAASVTDPIADVASQLLTKAEALSGENSEVYCIKKMIASLRMMPDPMNRYMTYGPIAAQALEQAKKLDPENPRVYMLEAQDKFYTPEQYGGSKAEAKTLFETAKAKMETHKPASSIHPSWGRMTIDYFLSQF
jgi:hypothetical protein